MAVPISLRLPAVYAKETSTETSFNPPTAEWYSGTWYVTHSSLPLWKDKRNVTITYKLVDSSPNNAGLVDDTASYQTLSSDKVKTVHGIDTPSAGNPGVFDWRGTGWLKVASSHWEFLGYGDLVDEDSSWMVTYFQKTLFTPAGIDVYSRKKEGVSEKALADIMQALQSLDHEEIRKLVDSIFKITMN